MLIYRADSANGKYSRVGKVDINSCTSYVFTDNVKESGRRYYYKIRCRSAYGETYNYGQYSDVVSCVSK